MKVLAIMGSPRKKGDTFRTTQVVEEHLKDFGEGEVELEYLFLKEADLAPCTGCFACTLKGKERCALKDDRDEIEERMLAANGVILASPAYVHNVSGLMKNFMDRFNYVCHRPRFFDQKALILSTGGGPWATKDCLERLKVFTFGGGFDQVSQVEAIGRPMSKLRRPEAVARERGELEKQATLFFEAMRAGERPRPTFQKLVFFRAMRVATSFSSKSFPRDHAYWAEKGWLDPKTKYFYPTKINPAKNLAAIALEGQIRRKMKKDLIPEE